MPPRLHPPLRSNSNRVFKISLCRNDVANERADAAGRSIEGAEALGDPDAEAGGEVLGEGGDSGAVRGVVEVGEEDEKGLVRVVGPRSFLESVWGLLVRDYSGVGRKKKRRRKEEHVIYHEKRNLGNWS
jgi:hypothetical protein